MLNLKKLLSIALISGYLASSATATPATIEKPNIILILADDLGAGMLSANGQKIVETPYIDKLLNEGMSFSNHYGNTYCAPSRWSLLTGMHSGRKGSGSQMRGGGLIFLDKRKLAPEAWDVAFKKIQAKGRKIPDQERFLAQVAQDAGYKTAQFGKLDTGFLTWHDQLKRYGWDHYVGYYDHVRAHGFYPPYLWRNGEKFTLPGNTSVNCGKLSEAGTDPVGSGGETYSQDVFDREMIQYVRDHKDQRFFLYHPSQLPHGPVAVTALHPDYADRVDLTLSEKKYATMVKSLDNTVGKIMKELKAQGLDEKTVVFFSSDNGHETYYQNADGQLPKKLWRKGKLADGSKSNNTNKKWRGTNGGDIFNGNGGRAALKWSAWQGGVNCPMIVRWPSKIKQGSKSPLLSTHYDFMPTLAELVGGKNPHGKDGVSYLPTLLGKTQDNTHDWIFIQNVLGKSLSTLITKNGWKLIQLRDKSFQLYNILDDPYEYKNVEATHPEVVKKLMPIFKAQLNSERPDLK